MNKQKIESLKQSLLEKKYREAGLIIPEILNSKQYRKFMEKVRLKLAKSGRKDDAHHFELVELQLMILERRLENLHEADTEKKYADEKQLLCQRVYDDAEQSLDYLIEKSSNLVDEEIIKMALEIMEKDNG